MNEKTDIIRSKKPIELQMAGVVILALIVFIFTTQIFRGIDGIMPFDMSGLTSLARWFVILATIVCVAMVWLRGNKSSYFVTKDSIVISRGTFGAKRKQVYGMEYVTGMSMNQSFFGSKFNYGHITLDLSLMTAAEVVRLTNVENPETTLQMLRTLAKKR